MTSVSQETRDKISQALTDYWSSRKKTTETSGSSSGSGQQTSPKSPEAQKLFGDYTKNKTTITSLMKQRESLKARSKSLGRKKTAKGGRDVLKTQAKQINAQLKIERAKQREVIRQATLMRHMAKLNQAIASATMRKAHADTLVKKSQALLSATKDKARAKRMSQYHERVTKFQAHQDEIIAKAKAKQVQYSNDYLIPKTSKRSSTFDFSENIDCLMLAEKAFVPYRALSPAEKRVNFTMLSEQFNSQEVELQSELSQTLNSGIDQFTKQAQDKITAGDVAAIAGASLLVRGTVRANVKKVVQSSYELGKSSAVTEINKFLSGTTGTSYGTLPGAGMVEKVEMPATSRAQAQIRNYEVEVTTDGLITEVENTGKRAILQAVSVGASDSATIASAANKMRDKASTLVKAVAGNIIAQNINRGRNEVFKANISRFSSFERSEIMDGRTCPLCISLDGKVVGPDDPMRETEQFHSYCRGIWVTIFSAEPYQPEITGIPTIIKNQFDLVDGRPITNAFKQLKMPLK